MGRTVIPDDKTMHYLQELDEKREEILMDFFFDYMILENNISGTSSALNVDGRLINKAYLLYCFNQGTVIPFNLGADPAYDSLLFSKLGEFSSACGFHPGHEFTRSILVDRKRLEELKRKFDLTEKDVEIIIEWHFGKEFNGLDGLQNYVYDIISLNRKSQRDKFASDVDQKLIGDLLDSMKLDYVDHRINEKIHGINPDTKNIIEEIDSILSNEMRPDYVDEVELERKIKEAFRKHRRFKFPERRLRIGKSHHGYSCEMNKGECDYLLNHEYLEAVKEKVGTARIVDCNQKKYLVFRGTSRRSFLGNRLDYDEEYRYSHIHYCFLEIGTENLNEIESIIKNLERSLHAVVARRFPIENCIKEQIEVDEEVLKERYIRHYDLLKKKKKESMEGE